MNRNYRKRSKEYYKEKENYKNTEENKKEKDKEKKEEENILDQLFFKTKTKPYIYYLPLNEEQIQKKLERKKKFSS